MKWIAVCLCGLIGVVGCGGDARLELAAADALLAVADEMELMTLLSHACAGEA